MTDYPTREAIEAAAETIYALQDHIDRDVPGGAATWSGLETARKILINLADAPGLHYPDAEPEPEPKPTAAEVLEAAWLQSDDGSANESILCAALRYAKTNPEWFADWHDFYSPDAALLDAAARADSTGDSLLVAASYVAADHRDLFGGAA